MTGGRNIISKTITLARIDNCARMLTRSTSIFARAASVVCRSLGASSSKPPTKVTFENDTHYKLHKLDVGPSTTFTVTRDDALNFYKDMRTIRCMETAAGIMYKEKIARGPCHLCTGQESICVGIGTLLRQTDGVFTGYRGHGWAHTRGISMRGILAEIAGRATGCSQGKGGSMHMFGKNFYGGHGVVGGQVPLGAGVALAMKYQGTDNVCVALYGDGAANQGQVFEAYNMAKLWNLPCIFVCENNQYGKWTSVGRASASTEFYTRGDYIPGIWVDGMNVLAVREAARFATEYCRSGKGPIVMECDSYRYIEHQESDQNSIYRSHEEMLSFTKRDPITGFRLRVLSTRLATEDEIQEIDKAIDKQVEDTVRRVKADPEPAPDQLYTHVCEQNPPVIRGCTAQQA